MGRRRKRTSVGNTSPTPMRGGNGSPTRQSGPSNAYSRLANSPMFPVGSVKAAIQAHSVSKVLTSSGLEFATWYSRDPFRTEKTEAIVFPYEQVSWRTFQTLTPGTTDSSATIVGNRVLALFQQIVDVINFNGRFTPNQLLTTSSDWTGYLNNYTLVFSILWSALCVIEALDVNQSFRAFATGMAGSGNLDRIMMAWRRLQLVPIPPGFVEYLAKVTGVKFSDMEDFGIVMYNDPNAALANITDWTSAAAVSTLIGTAETQLAVLEGNTLENNLIQEVLSIVYGPPAPLPAPIVDHNQLAFDLVFTSCATYLVTALTYSEPQLSVIGPGGTLPVLIRKGLDGDPMADIAFSLLRPSLYDASAIVGSMGASHSNTGLFNHAAGSQNFSRYYGADATSNNTILSESTFLALNYGNGTFFEVQWWADFVSSTSGTQFWGKDSRAYDKWNSYYPNAGAIASNSIALLDKIFFKGMKINVL